MKKLFLVVCMSVSSLLFSHQEIIDVGRYLNAHNLCPATSGNISVRLDSDRIAITVSGKHKGELTPEDVIVVDLEGKPVNSPKKPSAETLMHTSLYALLDECGAVIHTHSQNGTVLTRLLEQETELVTKGYEIHKALPGITTHESEVHIPIFENSQDIVALAQEVSAYLSTHPDTYGYLIRGHGFYTWGKDMREAKIRLETFEYLFACELLLAPPKVI